MGFLLPLARKLELISERSDCQQKRIVISRAKSDLASKIADYEMMRNDFDSNSPEAKEYNQRIERLNEVEKRLDEQMAKIQARLEMIEGEYSMCDEMVKTGIQRMYS